MTTSCVTLLWMLHVIFYFSLNLYVHIIVYYFSLQMDNRTRNMFGSIFNWVIWITLFIWIGLSHNTGSLDFSQSSLTEVPISPADQAITSIRLDKNNIQELFPYSFKNYDKLTKIYITYNGLRRIYDGTFDNIHYLSYINLNVNSIVQLPVNFGPSTSRLFNIDLVSACADLSLLTHPYFSAFTGLAIINIGLNNIGNLNNSFFPPNIRMLKANTGTMDTFPLLSSLTTDVQSLELADHLLTIIPQEAIARLFDLNDVHLNDNKIRNFPNFSHCTKLTLLRFERNDLSYIPRQHIEGLESICEMHFSNNWLVNMTDISHLVSLQRFFIDNNLIAEIPSSFLEGLTNMKTFACNNNKLKSLPNISALFPQLEELYV